jgi:hypothetical protein
MDDAWRGLIEAGILDLPPSIGWRMGGIKSGVIEVRVGNRYRASEFSCPAYEEIYFRRIQQLLMDAGVLQEEGSCNQG